MIDPELIQRALVSRIQALEAENEAYCEGLGAICALVLVVPDRGSLWDEDLSGVELIEAKWTLIEEQLMRRGVGAKPRGNGE